MKCQVYFSSFLLRKQFNVYFNKIKQYLHSGKPSTIWKTVTCISSTLKNSEQTVVVICTYNRNRHSSGLSLMNQLTHINRKWWSYPHCCDPFIIIIYLNVVFFLTENQDISKKKKCSSYKRTPSLYQLLVFKVNLSFLIFLNEPRGCWYTMAVAWRIRKPLI